MKKKNETILDYFDADTLIYSSFRYFLGRMTIATCDYAQCLAHSWKILPENVKQFIVLELEEAFLEDDRDRAMGKIPKSLGMDCDREAWEKVRRCYIEN